MNLPVSVILLGTGCTVPERVFRNEEFLATIDTSDEWIRTRTGIRERRYAAPHETSSSLAITASRNALVNAGLEAKDIDLIVCASVTQDMMTPSNANLIQAGLGCRQIPAFDIVAACTGFLYALSVGEQFIRAGTSKNVLVVGAEVLTRVTDFSNRNTCILFGDGAGAAILSASQKPGVGIRAVHLYSDGEKQKLIQVPSHTTIAPSPTEPRLAFLEMNGREVFRFAVCRMTELVQEAIRECAALGITIDLLIPHQVNQRIIDAALEATGFPADKVMVNLDRYGNTSAASVPIAMDEALRQGRAGPGMTILLVAFGGGLTWGSTIITL